MAQIMLIFGNQFTSVYVKLTLTEGPDIFSLCEISIHGLNSQIQFLNDMLHFMTAFLPHQ